MGVHGLWELLAPVGRRVSVEVLRNRKLAIDASIWIIQFMKAMRDERGDMIRNAHLLGFFRRITKLLFLRAKPIFVFDGGTPALKKRTVIARRRQRENAQSKIRKTAEKLLLNQLRARKIEEISQNSSATELNPKKQKKGGPGRPRRHIKEGLNDSSTMNLPSTEAQLEAQQYDTSEAGALLRVSEDVETDRPSMDVDALLAASLAAESEGEEPWKNVEMAAQSSDGSDEEQLLLPASDGQVDPAVLASLPPSMQLDLLVQMREQLVAENRQRFQKVAKAPASFSELQIQAYLKTVAFRREINQVQKSAASGGIAGMPSSRIVSETDREFIFSSSFHGEKQALNMSVRNVEVAEGGKKEAPNTPSKELNVSRSNMEQSSVCTEQAQFNPAKGQAKVSKFKGMGVRMTRDLQWNLYLLKDNEARAQQNGLSSSISMQDTQGDDGGTTEREGITISFVNDGAIDLGQDEKDLFEGLVTGKANLHAPNQISSEYSQTEAKALSEVEHDDDNCIWEDGGIDGEFHDTQVANKQISGESDLEWEDINTVVEDVPDVVALPKISILHSESAQIEEAIRRSLEDFRADGGGTLLHHCQLLIKEPANDNLSIKASNNQSEKHINVKTKPIQIEEDDEEEAKSVDVDDSFLEQERARKGKAIIREFSATNETVWGGNPPIELSIQSKDDSEICIVTQESAENFNDVAMKAMKQNGVLELMPLLRKDEQLLRAKIKDLLEDGKNSCEETCNDIAMEAEEQNEVCEMMPVPRRAEQLLAAKIKDLVPDGKDSCVVNGGSVETYNDISVKSMEQSEVLELTSAPRKAEQLSGTKIKDLVEDGKDCIMEKDKQYANLPEKHIEFVVKVKESQGAATAEDSKVPVFWETDDALIKEAEEMDINMEREVLLRKEAELLAEEEDLAQQQAELQAKLKEEQEELKALLENERESLLQEELELRDAQKKNQRDAESVTGEMFQECQELLQMFGIPYIIAPMEAEAQCAFLDSVDLVDGVVTEDCDVFLFGGRNVYKNIFDDRKYVETYYMKDIEEELGLSQEKLIHMALLLGSDYTEGISGIGIVNALEVVNAFPNLDGLKKLKEWLDSPDLTILEKVKRKGQNKSSGHNVKQANREMESSMEEQYENDLNKQRELDGAMEALQQEFIEKHRVVSKNWNIPDSFPSDVVIVAYKSPQVDQSIEPFSWGRPDLEALRKMCFDKFGWSREKADELLLPVLKEYDRRETQLQMEAFYSFNQRFAKIRSKRIQKAVKSISGHRSAEMIDLPRNPVAPLPKRKKTKKENTKSVSKEAEGGGENPIFRSEEPSTSSAMEGTNATQGKDTAENPSNKMESIDRSTKTQSKGRGVERGKGGGRGRGRGRGRENIEASFSDESEEEESLGQRKLTAQLKGRGRGRGRGRGNFEASFSDESDEESYEPEIDISMPSFVESSSQTRRSSRRKKEISYKSHMSEEEGSGSDSNDKNETLTMPNPSIRDFGPREESSAGGERLAGADICMELPNDDGYELQKQLIDDELVSMRETETVIKAADYLFMGGGFCISDDEDKEEMEAVVKSTEEENVTWAIDSESYKNVADPNPDHVSSTLPDSSSNFHLKALPSLRRKRRPSS